MNEQNIDPHQSQIKFGGANTNAHSVPDAALAKVKQEGLSDGRDIHEQLLQQLQQGELYIVNPRRKNGLIIYKTYHAEFAGPGAVIGGQFDQDVSRLLAVGNLSCIPPQNSQAKKQAYKMRRQWVRLTKQIIDNPQPTERAQVILNQFEHWFDVETVADLPDEAFALLVGVLPQTIRKVRNIELL